MENTKIASSANIVKQSVILGDVTIGEDSVIPDGSLAAGNPAKVKRQLTDGERRKLYNNSLHYVETGKKLKKDGYCI